MLPKVDAVLQNTAPTEDEVFMEPTPLLQTPLDYAWVLLSAALVFMMQAGFMCLESGMASAKNSINIAIKNLADFVTAAILFWIIGFGLMFGGTREGWIGASYFMVRSGDSWIAILFVFQAVFAGTAATIVSGAISCRTRFRSYLFISALISGLIYPVFGHWAWGGLIHNQAGWLEALGFKDFAGSTVVHSVGGWMSLAGIIVVGPRIGKFSARGKANPIPPHNMTLSYLGAFVLFFGWFGFNCGSTLQVSPQIGGIALNTLLGGSFGCVAASALSWVFSPFHRPRGEMIANGLLGGLVGVTAGCAFVESVGAMWIGLVSGFIVFFGSEWIEKVLKLDDVVGAVPVHGFCGVWGTVAVGLFIQPEYLGDLSRLEQIGVQLLGSGACFAWAFGVGFLLLKLVDRFTGGMRTSRESELMGLNISEHGASSSLLDLVETIRSATEKGDFTDAAKVEVEIGTEIGDLAYGFNRMVDAIQTAIVKTRHQAALSEKARQDAETAKVDLEESRGRYETYIRNIAGSLQEMMTETEQSMRKISDMAHAVRSDVHELKDHSSEIDRVMEMIGAIADTMKMLSMNALVESSHAGRFGNSFSVVAENMRALAQRTGVEAEKISEMTGAIQASLSRTLSSVEAQYETVIQGNEKILRAVELVQNLLQENRAGAAG